MPFVFRWLLLSVITATTTLAQVTWIQQPAAASGEVGGDAQFSFVARVAGSGHDLGVSVRKVRGGSASSRFKIVSVGIQNVMGTSGSYTEGSYTVAISSLTNSDAGSYTFHLSVNGLAGTPASQEAALVLLC